MEDSSNGKHLKESDEIREPILNNVKSESDNEKDGEYNEDNDTNDRRQTDINTERGQDIPSSSTDEPAIGKRSIEDNEVEILSLKKMKSESDNKEDDGSKDDTDEIQKQWDMKTRKNEESHFLRLFTLVLNTIIVVNDIKDDDISENIPKVKDSFKTENKPQTFHKIDLTQRKNMCAYLYRFGSHGAGFARYRILNCIQNCDVVKTILKKPDLRIINLGSGGGNDAVGLCSALSELQYPKSLKLTLVDKIEEWSLCIKLVKLFINELNFGKTSEFFKTTDVQLQFIQANLPGELEKDKKYFELLAEADVIIMSKFITSLDRKNYGEHERAIIKSLHENMKKDAVILVSDTIVYFEDRWEGFRRIYSWSEKMEDNYQSTALAQGRFESDDDVTSKLPVYVIVKDST